MLIIQGDFDVFQSLLTEAELSTWITVLHGMITGFTKSGHGVRSKHLWPQFFFPLSMQTCILHTSTQYIVCINNQ